MTDYTELIRSLKACEHDECYPERCDWFGKYKVDLRCKNILLANAAAAIEALQALLKEADKKQAYQHDYICELVAEVEELKAQLPKRGEWIYKPKDAIEMMFTLPKCSVCGHESSDANNYCPNCGAKMEVQE